MSAPPILFVKPKAISNADRKALRAAGVIVVEIDNLQDAKFVYAGYEMEATQMLRCAAKAISKSDVATKAFGAAVASVLSADGIPK
jgi:hypothetical protein